MHRLLFFYLIPLYFFSSCNFTETSHRETNVSINSSYSDSNSIEFISNTSDSSTVTDYAQKFKLGWDTPFLTPVGSDISRVIRAYFMVGEYETMLKFVSFPECYSKEEIKYLLRKSKWGYEIKATNLHWNPDSSFVMTIKTNKQQTIGSEQYYGVLINDTAKLVLFPEKETLFTFYGDENLADPCELKTAMDNIFFEFDQAIIKKSSYAELTKIKNYLQRNSHVSAHFTGHTSNEGTNSYNLNLSKERAKAICNYLIKNGISENRLTWKGKGTTEPIAPNDTEENRKKNRRVEIKIIQ